MIYHLIGLNDSEVELDPVLACGAGVISSIEGKLLGISHEKSCVTRVRNKPKVPLLKLYFQSIRGGAKSAEQSPDHKR